MGMVGLVFFWGLSLASAAFGADSEVCGPLLEPTPTAQLREKLDQITGDIALLHRESQTLRQLVDDTDRLPYPQADRHSMGTLFSLYRRLIAQMTPLHELYAQWKSSLPPDAETSALILANPSNPIVMERDYRFFNELVENLSGVIVRYPDLIKSDGAESRYLRYFASDLHYTLSGYMGWFAQRDLTSKLRLIPSGSQLALSTAYAPLKAHLGRLTGISEASSRQVALTMQQAVDSATLAHSAAHDPSAGLNRIERALSDDQMIQIELYVERMALNTHVLLTELMQRLNYLHIEPDPAYRRLVVEGLQSLLREMQRIDGHDSLITAMDASRIFLAGVWSAIPSRQRLPQATLAFFSAGIDLALTAEMEQVRTSGVPVIRKANQTSGDVILLHRVNLNDGPKVQVLRIGTPVIINGSQVGRIRSLAIEGAEKTLRVTIEAVSANGAVENFTLNAESLSQTIYREREERQTAPTAWFSTTLRRGSGGALN